MDKKVFKDVLLLLGIIIIAAVGARVLAGGETLTDYAKNNPKALESSSQQTDANDSIFQETTGKAGSGTIDNDAGNTASHDNALKTTGIKDSNITGSNIQKSDEKGAGTETEAPKDNEDIMSDNTTLTKEGTIEEKPTADGKDDNPAAAESASAPSSERVSFAEGFYYEPISNDVFKRISGISYPVDCTVSLDELRYMVVRYVDFEGKTKSGELICNKALAQDLVEIFSELYNNDYRIESIKLVDEFGGDDTASMLANNTSCFNYRVVPGTTHISNHAKGRAIDINPFYNPYITYNKDGTANISPEGSEPYADRTASFPYKIDENDLAYKLFKEHGFTWGGNWNSVKDYQHFEKK